MGPLPCLSVASRPGSGFKRGEVQLFPDGSDLRSAGGAGRQHGPGQSARSEAARPFPPPRLCITLDKLEKVDVISCAPMGFGSKRESARALPSGALVLSSDQLLRTSATVVGTGVVSFFALYVPAGIGACLMIVIMGSCGCAFAIALRVRERGAASLLPAALREALLTTSLLDWLTDMSFFNRIRPYAIFLLGLNEEETQLAVGALPRRAQERLLRPGVLHLLPEGVQRAMVPQPPLHIVLDFQTVTTFVSRLFFAAPRPPPANPQLPRANGVAPATPSRPGDDDDVAGLREALAWDSHRADDSPLRVQGVLVTTPGGSSRANSIVLGAETVADAPLPDGTGANAATNAAGGGGGGDVQLLEPPVPPASAMSPEQRAAEMAARVMQLRCQRLLRSMADTLQRIMARVLLSAEQMGAAESRNWTLDSPRVAVVAAGTGALFADAAVFSVLRAAGRANGRFARGARAVAAAGGAFAGLRTRRRAVSAFREALGDSVAATWQHETQRTAVAARSRRLLMAARVAFLLVVMALLRRAIAGGMGAKLLRAAHRAMRKRM